MESSLDQNGNDIPQPPETTTDPPRRRRVLRAAVALVALVVIAGGLMLVTLQGYLWLTGERSLLSEGEWRRLEARIRMRAEQPTAHGESVPPDNLPEREPRVIAPTRLAQSEPDPQRRQAQLEAYQSETAKTVVELQPFRQAETSEIVAANGSMATVTLLNLNPHVNSWYLLFVRAEDGTETVYHLVNGYPKRQDIGVDDEYREGLVISDTSGARRCELWPAGRSGPLVEAVASGSPYASLCGGDITLRLVTPGRRTTLEWSTDFLRDNVWGGESITTFIREKLFQDAYIENSALVEDGDDAPTSLDEEGVPRPARLDERFLDMAVVADDLGLTPAGVTDGMMTVGRWYPALNQAGVFLSVVQPGIVAPDILQSHRGVVSPLDEVERDALVYLVAFDLLELEVGFAIGTEHPRVGWSARVLDSERDPALLGPDGIGDIPPIVATGIVPRSEADRTIATFTGGFKRDHGAFRVSELATRNHGSHYGFIESGVVLSKLQPGLATIFALTDGRVDMRTWTEADDALLPDIVFARQNGVPILERDPAGSTSVPGEKVSKWAAGNWSGSQDRKFRTVRAAAALQENGESRFLVYTYFSSATPSAMARVFQAYDCDYAMMLDMNALEHTYLALYTVEDGKFGVEHLVRGMEVLDKSVNGNILPRFLGFADNRDFFYVRRKMLDAPGTGLEVEP